MRATDIFRDPSSKTNVNSQRRLIPGIYITQQLPGGGARAILVIASAGH